VAWIEIAPYERGAFSNLIFRGSNSVMSTEIDGTLRLTLPSAPSVLSCASTNAIPGCPTGTSGNLVIDPAHPPPSPLSIVIPDPARLDVEASGAGTFDILDQHDLTLRPGPPSTNPA
jgi:hypothetical protein